MYKNQLQELAQRSCFNLPSYACIREGPDHAPRFKATVNFNGEVFESPLFYSTLRQAEHAAAEVALNILAKRGPSKALAARVLDETGVYKNLLQETAHRAGLNLPAYTTVRSGPGHVPSFSCTVELAGMTFTGETSKTKKQAQKNAAFAAWSALKQMSQQDSSSSHSRHPGIHEEQEQVIVARFLASLLPTLASNTQQNNPQIKHKKSASSMKSLPSTPSLYCGQYQNYSSSNLSPGIALYYMWLQEQAAEQQNHLLALPVSPLPPQLFPLMHSIARPSYHPYCLPPGQQPVSSRPGVSLATNGPPFYFLDQSIPEPSSMVTIREIREDKIEDASQLPASEVPSQVGEQLQKDETQANCLEESSTRRLASGVLPRDSLSTESHAIGSSNYSPQSIHVPTPSYNGRTRPSPPTAPMILNSTSIAGRTMRTMPPSATPWTPDRIRSGGLPPRYIAPAVQIRSVVPVCSALPRKMTESRRKELPDHEIKDRETEMSSKLGNLHI